MKIKLIPQGRPQPLSVNVAGDAVAINGEVFDFTALLDGETLPLSATGCEWFAEDVARIGGVIHVTLFLPHDSSAPYETRFPEHPDVYRDVEGEMELPPYGEG